MGFSRRENLSKLSILELKISGKIIPGQIGVGGLLLYLFSMFRVTCAYPLKVVKSVQSLVRDFERLVWVEVAYGQKTLPCYRNGGGDSFT